MKERKSNLELLRIILIIMIIALHYNNTRMGGVFGNVENGTFNYYLSNFVESLSIVAVNTFILITGYFSNKKDSVKVSKVINLFYICAIYGILIFGTYFVFTKNISFGILKEFIKTIFDRWFVVIYSILYLLISYLNKLINSLDKEKLKILIIINTLFFYVWFTIFTNTTIKDGGYGIINFINLYLIGAYIKKYKDEYVPKYKTIIIYISCAIITTLLSCFTTRSAFAYNTIFNLIGSIALFLTFKNLNIKNNKVINYLSTFTFSTYIIHENSFITKFLYRTIFKCDKYYNSSFIVINLLYTIIGIYVICIIFEIIRRFIMNKIDKKIDNIDYELKV